MAASPRSPLMRDSWRADEDSGARPRDRTADRQPRTPIASRQRDRSSEGLRIRGRAADESTAKPRKEVSLEGQKADKAGSDIGRKRSPPPRRQRGEEAPKRAREASGERGRGRREAEYPENRRRSTERPPARDIFDFRDAGTRRPPSPVGRINRGTRPDRHTDRTHSPPRGPREDRYSSASRFGDSYIPRARRPSPQPRGHRSRNDTAVRGRSRSREKPVRHRRPSVTPTRRPTPPPEVRSLRRRQQEASVYRPRQRSHDSYRGRKVSVSPPRGDKVRAIRNSSRSPARKRRRNTSRENNMQHSYATPQQIPPSHPGQHGNSHNPSFPSHGMRAHNTHYPYRQPRPAPLDSRHQYSNSPQWTPTTSHQGSPHSASPYGYGRGGWGSQQQQYQQQAAVNAYSPPHPHRQNSYPAQQSPSAQYHQSGHPSPYPHDRQQHQHGYPTQPARGGHPGYRGNHYGSTHFPASGSPAPQAPTQGPQRQINKNGHYQNLQWTSGDSGRPRDDGSYATQPDSGPNDEDDNPFRPSKDLQVEDQAEKDLKAKTAASASPKENSKVSFAFKAKPQPAAGARPPPDLSQGFKEPSRNKEPPRQDHESSADKAGRDHRGKYRSRDARYDNNIRHERDHGHDRGRNRTPALRSETRVIKEKRPKRTLSPGLADSSSVYYRKPGNESVVGSGTYGKVFKAIHVYTKNLAALKKIRMDGEKDGFPVTAVREIKLLQSLKHESVVSLQEVMVEHNDCFMVFEYLSHDLTGLLNHPSFKLEPAHKKDLARQLFEGLNYLHRRGVLHRDIKAANILISNQGQLKIADFGLARFYSKRGKPDYTNRVVTIWYRSPELLLGETQYGPAVDMWSAACVMVEIFTRHAIFPGDGGEINQLDKIYNVLGTPTRSEWPGLVDMAWFELLRPTERKLNTFAEKYQSRVTPSAYELLVEMLQYDPNKRPTASDVLNHPYFTVEEPAPRQAFELKDLSGEWHEFESKALRKENERKKYENDRKSQEVRRAARNEEHEREKAKRRVSSGTSERDVKRPRLGSGHGTNDAK